MDIRHLRYAVAIAEEGSFTRAAQRLGIQQPPLSQQLKALERELGHALFQRHARGVEPTAAGAAFVQEARRVIASLERAAERTRQVARGFAGSLTLGLATSAASHRMSAETIAAFRARYPEVDLLFLEGNAAALTEAIDEGRADVALIRAPVSRPTQVRFHKLVQEPVLAALAKSHPLAAAARGRNPASISLAALRDDEFILVRQSGAPGIYGDLVAACRKAGFEPRIAAEVGNMTINTMLVAAGVGVSVVPASMRGSHAALVDYLALREGLVAPLTVAWSAKSSNPAVASFREVASRVSRGARARR
jgi:DNA-binding transcriptional LysR family regulator